MYSFHHKQMEVLPNEIWNIIIKLAQEPNFALCSIFCSEIWTHFTTFNKSSEFLMELCSSKDIRTFHPENKKFFSLEHAKFCFNSGFLKPWERFVLPDLEKENREESRNFYFRWLGRTRNKEKIEEFLKSQDFVSARREESIPESGEDTRKQNVNILYYDCCLFGSGEAAVSFKEDDFLKDFDGQPYSSASSWILAGFYHALKEKEKLVEFCESRNRKGIPNHLDNVLYFAGRLHNDIAASILQKEYIEAKSDKENQDERLFNWGFFPVEAFARGCIDSGFPELYGKTMKDISKNLRKDERKFFKDCVADSMLYIDEFGDEPELEPSIEQKIFQMFVQVQEKT